MYNFVGTSIYKVDGKRVPIPPGFLREIRRINGKEAELYLIEKQDPWRLECYPRESFELLFLDRFLERPDDDPERLEFLSQVRQVKIKLDSKRPQSKITLPISLEEAVILGNCHSFIITSQEGYKRLLKKY
ncbi:MAG: hypothetical protein DRP12_01170 [Candidatus Aenigmatarchaeota archaeon]|nr:MAG: hypothetical protein DRP12_01170 [Candidatus Aenigmarchaeota archaeon]